MLLNKWVMSSAKWNIKNTIFGIKNRKANPVTKLKNEYDLVNCSCSYLKTRIANKSIVIIDGTNHR